MKLKEYKEQKAKDCFLEQAKEQPYYRLSTEGIFIEGFDACLELNLHIKFAEWVTGKDASARIFLRKYVFKNKKIPSIQERWDYWMENILNIE